MSHPGGETETTKRFVKGADGDRIFFLHFNFTCVLPNSIRLGVTWAFSDSISWRTRNKAARAENWVLEMGLQEQFGSVLTPDTVKNV